MALIVELLGGGWLLITSDDDGAVSIFETSNRGGSWERRYAHEVSSWR